GRNPGKDFRLFVVGKRWSQTIPAEVFEGVLTKDVDWSAVEKVGEVLISRFRNGFSDACYVILQRPAKDTPAGGGLAKIQGTTVSIEQAPLLYGVFEHPYESGFSSGPEAGGYRPLTLRFLPPQAKETPRSALNIEGDEDMFVEGVLRMYLEVFLKSVFLDHFTALNLARQRTLRRVMKNIDEKLTHYRNLINRLRQERINSEIQDMVLALVSSEERLWVEFRESGSVLEVDAGTPDDLRSLIASRLTALGFRVSEVRERDLIGGFRITGPGRKKDMSVEGALSTLKEKAGKLYFDQEQGR
ncbi:MAG: F0F1 ATP synthase subunit gamma, partial [Aquificota bacterium]|nr:F0F1 ATP synthase subunit gamma [Aquificota bacterium]